MLKYADCLKEDELIECDVCIVGSGAAGITLGRQLINSGLTVYVLESSARSVPNMVAPEQLEQLERLGTTLTAAHRSYDPCAQTLYEGLVDEEMAIIDPAFMTRSRIRVYGGTTNCWGGRTRTLDAIDFDRKDLDPLFRWPISRHDLQKPYEVALRYCSLEPIVPSAYDRPDWWVGQTAEPIEIMPQSEWLKTAPFADIDRSRWDFQSVWGPDIERAANVTIWRNANVRKIVTPPDGRTVIGLEARTIGADCRPGTCFRVKASRFVLAMGGIETVRLLLLSGFERRNPRIGRYFMVHPLNGNAGTFTPTGNYSQEIFRYYSRYDTRLKGGNYPPRCFGALGPTDRYLLDHGIGNFRSEVNLANGSVNLNWEQVPNVDSRIVLHPTRRDLFGDPEVLLDWRTTALDRKTAKAAMTLTQDELVNRKYSTRHSSNPYIAWPGDHHMGTTRMSPTRDTGCVDRDCRIHETNNLWIASSSVFSSGGVANPTLTIIALAARLGARLLGREQPEFVPSDGEAAGAERA